MLKLGLKTSWESLARFRLASRKYATHRELRPRFNSSQNPRGWWSYWKVPLAFTAGVVAFDYFVLPRIMNLQVMAPIRRNPQIIVYSIIGLNVAGFFAWRMPGPFSASMARYGLLQKQPAYFNVGQMLGSAFSHQNGMHLAINMFVLYQFGAPIANWLGSSLFLEAYLDSCVLSSLGSMLLPMLVRKVSVLPSLGASGAVFSCVGIFSYLLPNAKIALWFIPLPIGAWYVFLITFGYNAFSMAARRGIPFTSAGIDYAGHVAGSMCGILYGWYAQKKIEERRRRVRSVSRFF